MLILARVASRLASEISASCLPSVGFTGESPHLLSFHTGVGNLISGPHSLMASSLSTEPTSTALLCLLPLPSFLWQFNPYALCSIKRYSNNDKTDRTWGYHKHIATTQWLLKMPRYKAAFLENVCFPKGLCQVKKTSPGVSPRWF